MLCLSLHQPWATLLAHGQKRVETRSWNLRHRGGLLVHAAKKWDADLAYLAASPPFRGALELCGVKFEANEAACRRGWNLPFGAIVGRVDVTGCYSVDDISFNSGSLGRKVNGWQDERGGRKYLCVSLREAAFGDYSPGRFAVLCTAAAAFPEPVPFRGKQGLFDVPEGLLDGVPTA